MDPLSYKVNIGIAPVWERIIQLCFPEIKDEKEARKFINRLFYDQKLNLNKEKSLVINPIDMIEFYDAVSGLNFSWHNQDKEFLRDLEVIGFMFHQNDECKESLEEKFPDNSFVCTRIAISPSGISFKTANDIENIASFPYYEVMTFFLNVQKHSLRGNFMVKQFPSQLQEIFIEHGIQYKPDLPIYINPRKLDLKPSESKWLKENGIEMYEQAVGGHFFETKYYSIYLDIEFFSPPNRDRYFS